MKTIISIGIALMLNVVFTTQVQSQTQITTAEELAAINNDDASLKGRYKLMNDLTVENWTPIGSEAKPFMGSFDGGGFTITVISIGDVASAPINTKSGTEIPAIETSFIGVFGYNGRRSLIQNLRVDGELVYESDKNENIIIGGVTGYNYGTVINCASEAMVIAKGSSDTGLCLAGGVIGINNGINRNCYSAGNITAKGSGVNYAGGITGLNDFDASIIQWCYAAGDISVNGGKEQYAGGVAGFSARGGLIQYCMALNGNILSDKQEDIFTGRYIGKNLGRVGGNFSRKDIILTDDKANPKGSDLCDPLFLKDIQWWTVNRHIRFPFGSDNARPWAWSEEVKRPVMHWEQGATASNQAITPRNQVTEIRTVEELAIINSNAGKLGGKYILMNDITVENWTPIGNCRNRFTGTFDGNGYTITINGIKPDILSTTRPFTYKPFGRMSMTSSIQQSTVQSFFVGLFGSTGNRSLIKNLRVAGTIDFDGGQYDLVVGGIVGENFGYIKNCLSSINVKGTAGFYNEKLKNWTRFSGGCYVGGFAGINNGNIINCYATGNISVEGKATQGLGGIAGSNGYEPPTVDGGYEIGIIENCFYSGKLSTVGDCSSRYVGGIAGMFTGDKILRLNKSSHVRNCVALNESIEVQGVVNKSFANNDCVDHIAGDTDGKQRNNYVRQDMKIEGYTGDINKNRAKTYVDYESTKDKNWWIGASDQFEYLFGTDDNAPWVWNEELKRPVLFWESNDYISNRNDNAADAENLYE